MSALTRRLRSTATSQWFSPSEGRGAPGGKQPSRKTLNSKRRYYSALDDHLEELARLNSGDLRRLAGSPLSREAIVARVDNTASSSTLYHLFDEKAPGSLVNQLRRRSPHLFTADQPKGAVERLVLEAKVAAFWPYRSGWLAMLEELGPVRPLVAAEALLRVVCEWAVGHARLAATLDFAPPVAAIEDLAAVAETDQRDVVAALHRVLVASIERSLDGFDVSPLGVLDTVRSDLVVAGFRVDDAKARDLRPDVLLAAAEHILASMSPAERRAVEPDVRRAWNLVEALLLGGAMPDAPAAGPAPPAGHPAYPATVSDQARTSDHATAGHDSARSTPDAGRKIGDPPMPTEIVGCGAAWIEGDGEESEPTACEDDAATIAAMHTLLHHAANGGDMREAEGIMAALLRRRPPDSAVTLQIECWIEELRSRHRPAVDSAAVWTELRERAEGILGVDNRTVMSMRSFETRYASFSRDAAALDAAVQTWHDAWIHRVRVLGPAAYRTRMGRVNLAKAMRERNRPGDLEQARDILREEADGTAHVLGPRHPFTLTVQAILAFTLLRIAEEHQTPAGGDAARDTRPAAVEAMGIIGELLVARETRFGPRHAPTLRARLLHAHALLLLGRHREAAREVAYVMAFAPHAQPPLDPGWAEVLLGRALAADNRTRALAAARDALRLRREHYPPGCREIMEAARLVEDLDDEPSVASERSGEADPAGGPPGPAEPRRDHG